MRVGPCQTAKRPLVYKREIHLTEMKMIARSVRSWNGRQCLWGEKNVLSGVLKSKSGSNCAVLNDIEGRYSAFRPGFIEHLSRCPRAGATLSAAASAERQFAVRADAPLYGFVDRPIGHGMAKADVHSVHSIGCPVEIINANENDCQSGIINGSIGKSK